MQRPPVRAPQGPGTTTSGQGPAGPRQRPPVRAPAARAAGTPEVAALLTPSPTSRIVLASGFTAAHSATLHPAVGEGWAAAGDAALAFDPLSSQGLLNSLFTGLAAAEAIARSLDGEPAALPGYAATLVGIRRAYRAHLAQGYGEERRWPERPFWRRRHDLAQRTS